MKVTNETELINYIEIPRRSGEPVKIDVILEERMRAFMRARRMKRFTFLK